MYEADTRQASRPRQTCNAAIACVAAEHDFDRLCVLATWTDKQHADPRRYRICKAIDKYSKTDLLAVQNLSHRYTARTLSCRLMWRKTFSGMLVCSQRRALQWLAGGHLLCNAKDNANRDVAAVAEEVLLECIRRSREIVERQADLFIDFIM